MTRANYRHFKLPEGVYKKPANERIGTGKARRRAEDIKLAKELGIDLDELDNW